MRQCKCEGCRVILLTSKSLKNVNLSRESLDEIFYIPDENKEWNMRDVIYVVRFLARTENIDGIVALDDYDVEKAASLKEPLRYRGMSDTTARYFNDKLAMHTRAYEVGNHVPASYVLNYKRIKDYIKRIPLPYLFKARLQVGACGINKFITKRSFENDWMKLETNSRFI